MTAPAPLTPPAVSLPPPDLTRRLYGLIVWGGVFVLLVWSFLPAEMHRLPVLWTHADNMAEVIGEFASPNFRYWRDYTTLLLETVQMAVWGTALSVLLGVPFGLLSSANLTPAWLRFPMRRLMDAARSINELVFALIFVSAVGLGPLAGVLALAVHTAGVLAKLYSEAVEAIDPRPIEGIRATGASHLQESVYGVIPQVLPLWISISLYRFESNVRSATVLGFVGAGGIGVAIYDTMRSFDFGAVGAILLMIIVVVSVVDIFSQYLRRVVIDGQQQRAFVLYLAGCVLLVLFVELVLAGIIVIDPPKS